MTRTLFVSETWGGRELLGIERALEVAVETFVLDYLSDDNIYPPFV